MSRVISSIQYLGTFMPNKVISLFMTTLVFSYRALLISLFLFVSACGGGGSNSTDNPIDDTDNESIQPSSMDMSTELDEQNNENANDAQVLTEDQNGDVTNTADVIESEDSALGVGSDTDAAEVDNSLENSQFVSEQDQASIFFFLEEGEPAPGANGRLLGPGVQSNIRINSSGDLVYIGRLEEDRFGGGNSLWGGSVFNPRLLLEPEVAVDGFAANIRLSSVEAASLANNGEIAAVVELSGASNEQAIIHFAGDALPVTIAQTNAVVETPTANLSLRDLRSTTVENGTVAFSATTINNNAVLVRSVNGAATIVAPTASAGNEAGFDLAPTQADGCKFLFTPGDDQFGVRPASFAALADGSVVFNAVGTIEVGALSNPAICPRRFAQVNPTEEFTTNLIGNRFESVIRLTANGEYQRLVSRGDKVPNMNAAFSSVEYTAVLQDGSIVVFADLLSYTDNSTAESFWLFDGDNNARLLAVEGETLRVGSETLNLQLNAFSINFSATSADNIAWRLTQRISGVDRPFLFMGAAHAGQPYADLDALGEANFNLIVSGGGTAPVGYPESAFFSGAGVVTVKPSGGGYFFGSIADAANSGDILDSGLWQFDMLGEITPVVLQGDVITTNEIPSAFENFSGIDRGQGVAAIGDNAVVMLQLNSRDERLVYWPVNQ